MKGLWKENISGWNSKNTKRKKQTRKHTLKDNGRIINNLFNKKSLKTKKIFRIENKVENIMTYGEYYPKQYKEIKSVKTYYINWYGKEYEAYKFKDIWYDINTNKEIKPFKISQWDEYMKQPIIVKYIDTYDFDDEIGRNKANKKHDFICGNYNQKEFIYDKILPSWKKMTFYNNGKRRKFAQKKANRRDRQYIKKWINNSDFDAEIKTHDLSKSILYEIY